jgi:uncharacterized membrane protein YesL
MMTIMMLVGGFGLTFVYLYVPIIFLFFGGPILAFVLMWIALKSFPAAKAD